jgi:hypothetical protein
MCEAVIAIFMFLLASGVDVEAWDLQTDVDTVCALLAVVLGDNEPAWVLVRSPNSWL